MNVYILYSLKKDKFYIGYTSESVDQRLSKHNSGYYGKKHFTASVSDWALFYDIKCSSNKQAIKIERHIKKMKSRTYIRNLKKYAEMSEKLLLRYKDT